jgi:DNA-binding LacI/PurR family transcriptional regulator/signal transduction histidine kinase
MQENCVGKSLKASETINPGQQNTRPTIGLLIDYARPVTAGGYHSLIWAGIADAVQERDANLICFAGRALREPYEFEVQRNVVYDLASSENVDGLILCGGLGNFVTPEAYKSFCDRYHPLPMVSVALMTEGIPTVLIDNEKGLRDAIVHLIEVHGHRRIAFIRGAEGNEEAEQRYRVYQNVLAEYGLPLNPALIAPGDFLPPTGKAAIHLLIGERNLRPGLDFEAIVAANDSMALGALEALQARGIRAPDDVALVGFDDVNESRVVMPPLTTVRQPLYEQGTQAANMLLAMLTGEETPEQVVLSTELVVRQSCGCLPQVIQQVIVAVEKTGDDSGPALTSETFETALVKKREHVLSEMIRSLGASSKMLASEWAERLLDAFVAEVTDQSSGVFLSTLDRLLRQVAWQDGDAELWHGMISVLYRHALPGLTDDSKALSRADSLWQQARILIGKMAWQARAYQELLTERQADVLGQINEVLITTFDIPALMDVLARELPRANIPSCYLSLYDEKDATHPADATYPGDDIPARWSRLMLAYNENGRIELEGRGRLFLSRKLAPGRVLPRERRYSMLVQPLFFREDQLGFILIEVGRQTQAVYEILRRQISSSLKGALLLRERKQAELELARSNTELEQFAYVVSHDLQEPLRMVHSYLQLLERRYQGQIDEDANEFIDFAVDGAARMHALITGLLAYSRVGTHTKPFEPTDCVALLESVLADLKVAIEESGAVITFDDLPTVMADDTQLRRVFQNLIGNAIKFRGDQPPEIHVSVEHKDRKIFGETAHWLFSVRDNGIGIEPHQFERIFLIFQRLYAREEYEGTGIGLAICRKIVERHEGHIWVESEPSQGSTFYFTVPDAGALRNE